MYFKYPLLYLYKKRTRNQLLTISKRVAKENNVNPIRVQFDIIFCSFRYGTLYTEYEDLDFYHRTASNRKTFITTIFNFKLYDKINEKGYRKTFHDKIKFLTAFSEVIQRKWYDLDVASNQDLLLFLENNKKAVLKASYGDSGKEVEVIDALDDFTVVTLIEYAISHKYNLLEECVENHPAMARLNESSLNTIRIVTLNLNGNVQFLFAGVRIGGKGAKVDNISQGGKVARINIDTGKIDTEFKRKINSYDSQGDFGIDECVGYQIPYWDDVKTLAKAAAGIVPEIKYVAWDICITPDGPEIIEGNESFGSVIMQVFSKETEEGLKPKLLEILKGNRNAEQKND